MNNLEATFYYNVVLYLISPWLSHLYYSLDGWKWLILRNALAYCTMVYYSIQKNANITQKCAIFYSILFSNIFIYSKFHFSHSFSLQFWKRFYSSFQLFKRICKSNKVKGVCLLLPFLLPQLMLLLVLLQKYNGVKHVCFYHFMKKLF